jgi:hypothetical protein
MKQRSILFILFAISILTLPVLVDAWSGTVTSNYSWDDDEKTGGGWTYYYYSRTTGDIKIEHNQYTGDCYSDIWIGHKITAPSYGDYWRVNWEMKHRVSYYVGSLFMGSYELTIKQELHDDEHGVEHSYTSYSKTDNGGQVDTTYTRSVTAYDLLTPDSEWYIVLHVNMKFHGWVWMGDEPDSGYNYARFDLIHIYWTFTHVGGGGGVPE